MADCASWQSSVTQDASFMNLFSQKLTNPILTIYFDFQLSIINWTTMMLRTIEVGCF